tara:strand:- start:87 stop:347 length:261 start_codon:yes stop_codon:yes gene_type:complete
MKKNIVLFSLISFSAILIDPFVNVKPAYSHKGASKFNCQEISTAHPSNTCFKNPKGSGYKHTSCEKSGLFKDGHRHDIKSGKKKKC